MLHSHASNDIFLLLHHILRGLEEHMGEHVVLLLFSNLADEVWDAQSSVYLLQSDAICIVQQGV